MTPADELETLARLVRAGMTETEAVAVRAILFRIAKELRPAPEADPPWSPPVVTPNWAGPGNPQPTSHP